MTTATANHRWFHLTPDRFFIGLLAVQVFLLLSERYQWFAFNEEKGWTVLIAVGVICIAMLVMVVWALVGLVLRRRFQFGVRSLLVFLVAVSMPMGWFAWMWESAREQRRIVAKIEAAGGRVYFRHAPTTTYHWKRNVVTDSVSGVDLSGTRVSDVSDLAGLNGLGYLDLSNTAVSDLSPLAELEELNYLLLSNTPVRDVSALAKLEKLGWLELANTNVSKGDVIELEQSLPNCIILTQPFSPGQ